MVLGFSYIEFRISIFWPNGQDTKAEAIRNAGKQEERILDFSCVAAFLIVLSAANG